MGIPRKGCRVILLDGKRYCYIVRTVPKHKGLRGSSGPVDTIKVTVQEDVDNPGNVLQAMYTAWTIITPLVVEELRSGGSPSRPWVRPVKLWTTRDGG